MATSYGNQVWTPREDHYLLTHASKYTSAMIAADLNRTAESVRYRIKRLRQQGVKVATIPAGRRYQDEQTEVTRSNAWVTEPEIKSITERDILRDEISAYLRSQVERRQLTVAQAYDLAEKLKYSVIHAPEAKFRSYLTMRVDEIVRRAA